MAEPVIPPPPPGFELDSQPTPPPPPGFVLDGAASATPAPENSIGAGAKAFAQGSGLDAIGEAISHPGEALKAFGPVLKDPTGAFLGGVKGILYDAPRAMFAKSREKYESGDKMGAAASALAGAIPGIGPVLNEAGEELQKGEYAKGAGRTLGVAASLFGPTAAAKSGIGKKLSGAAKKVSTKLYTSAMKPAGKDVARIDKAMDVGVRNGILPNRAGIAKFDKIVSERGKAIGGALDQAPDVPSIKSEPVVKSLSEAREGFLPSERASFDAAAEDFFSGLRQPDGSFADMTPLQAHDLKVRLQDAVVRSKKTAYAGGAINGPGIEAWQTAARGVRGELIKQFPELKGAYAEYSALKALDPILDSAATRIAKHEPFGLIATIMAGAGGQMIGGGLKSGVGSLIVAKIVLDPVVRARLATAMSRASGGSVSALQAASRLQAFAKSATSEAMESGAPQAATTKVADETPPPALEFPAIEGLARDARGRFVSQAAQNQARLADYAKP